MRRDFGKRADWRLRVCGCALLLTWWVGCGGSGPGERTGTIDQSLSIDFGTVVVGQAAMRRISLDPASAVTTLVLRSAPDQVEVPARVDLGVVDEPSVSVAWTPLDEGRLDAAVVYTGAQGEVVLILQVRGTASAAQGDAGRPLETSCDDVDPCAVDVRSAQVCERDPLPEGAPCGPADCSVGHFCAAGRCTRVDVSNVREGSACDDGNSCTTAGSCRGGLCYASETPRDNQQLATLPLFAATSRKQPRELLRSATDGEVFVFTSASHIDVLTRDEDGALRLRARLREPTAHSVRTLDAGRFVIRTDDAAFVLLDARTPDDPRITPLDHVVPKPLHSETQVATRVGFIGTGVWAVHGGLLLVPTHTSREPGDVVYHLTVAPVDAELGFARAVDVEAYRLASLDDALVYTVPYGRRTVGVMRLAASGEIEFHQEVDASALDCGFPRHIDAHEDWFVTYSDEHGTGAEEVCLWRATGNPTTGLERVAARAQRDSLSDHRVDLDARYVYLGFGRRYGSGAGSASYGEVVRFEREWFTAGEEDFSLSDGERISEGGNGLSTSVEAGYLLGLRGTHAVVDLEADLEPVTAPGAASFDALLEAGSRRVLAGGDAHVAVVELSEVEPPTLTWGAREARNPVSFELRRELRVLRHGERVVLVHPSFETTNLDPVLVYTYQVGDRGALQDIRSELPAVDTYSGAAWVFGSTVWSTRYNSTTGEEWLLGQNLADPEGDPLEIDLAAVEGRPGAHLRTDSEGTALFLGSARTVTELDVDRAIPLVPPLAPNTPVTHVAYGYGGSPELVRRFGVDGDQVWMDAGGGIRVHDRATHQELAVASFDGADVGQPTTIEWLHDSRALLAYVDTAGDSHLVQVRLDEDGQLRQLAELRYGPSVRSAVAVDDGRFLVAGEDEIALFDLQCWDAASGGAP